MSTLGEQFPVEQARVRELVRQYREIGPGGSFAATWMETVLRRADRAAASGDVVAMVRAFAEMQGCE